MGIALGIAEKAGASMTGLSPAEEFARRMDFAQQLNSKGLAPMANLAVFSALVAGPHAAKEFSIWRNRYDVVGRAAEANRFVVVGKANINAETEHDHRDTMVQVIIPTSGLKLTAEVREDETASLILPKASIKTTGFYEGSPRNRTAHSVTHINNGRKQLRYVEEYIASFFCHGELDELALRVMPPPIDSRSAWIESGILLSGKQGDQQHLTVIGENHGSDPLHDIFNLADLAEKAAAKKRYGEDQIRLVAVVARAIEQSRTGEDFASGAEFMHKSNIWYAGAHQFRERRNISRAAEADLAQLMVRAARM